MDRLDRLSAAMGMRIATLLGSRYPLPPIFLPNDFFSWKGRTYPMEMMNLPKWGMSQEQSVSGGPALRGGDQTASSPGLACDLVVNRNS